jgi:hypothetical protein
MRTSQRNLHHQLLRSGVLITRSSHAGMPVQIGTVVWCPTHEEFIVGCWARAAPGHAAAAPNSSQIAIRTGPQPAPAMRGRTMQRLKAAGGFLVCREGLETDATPTPLNDKAGNFAGIGEYGCHGTNDNRDGDSECRRKTRRRRSTWFAATGEQSPEDRHPA